MSDPDFLSDLEAVFAAVLSEARAKPAFAKKIAVSVAQGRTLKELAKRRTEWATEAPQIDLDGVFRKEGEEGVRRALRALPKRKIYAWLKVSRLGQRRTSGLNTTQLIEHIVRELKRANGADTGSRFNY